VVITLTMSNPWVFQPNYQNKDVIKNNLINYFLTNPGERIENPLFGAGLRKYIFTQIETGNLDFIKEDVQTKLNENFSNINVEEVEVLRSVDVNTIKIRSEEHKSEIQSLTNIVCRLLLEKKKKETRTSSPCNHKEPSLLYPQ